MSNGEPESDFLHVVTHKVAMMVPTPLMVPVISKEKAARRNKREELERLGLLDDLGETIEPTECPACYGIADGTAAGWNGPLGDDVRCERPRGHTGSHLYTIRWEDDERPSRS